MNTENNKVIKLEPSKKDIVNDKSKEVKGVLTNPMPETPDWFKSLPETPIVGHPESPMAPKLGIKKWNPNLPTPSYPD